MSCTGILGGLKNSQNKLKNPSVASREVLDAILLPTDFAVSELLSEDSGGSKTKVNA
jgi:hypothetical protein